MSSAEVNSPSPASIGGGSDTGGGTFPLTETPPPGYMSEDGDTQEPGDLMSKSIPIKLLGFFRVLIVLGTSRYYSAVAESAD